jgi:hypothetical protein
MQQPSRVPPFHRAREVGGQLNLARPYQPAKIRFDRFDGFLNGVFLDRRVNQFDEFAKA